MHYIQSLLLPSPPSATWPTGPSFPVTQSATTTAKNNLVIVVARVPLLSRLSYPPVSPSPSLRSPTMLSSLLIHNHHASSSSSFSPPPPPSTMHLFHSYYYTLHTASTSPSTTQHTQQHTHTQSRLRSCVRSFVVLLSLYTRTSSPIKALLSASTSWSSLSSSSSNI